jgi:hypothetical protein
LEFYQHLGSLKHVVNIIMWFRDMGCYRITHFHVKYYQNNQMSQENGSWKWRDLKQNYAYLHIYEEEKSLVSINIRKRREKISSGGMWFLHLYCLKERWKGHGQEFLFESYKYGWKWSNEIKKLDPHGVWQPGYFTKIEDILPQN